MRTLVVEDGVRMAAAIRRALRGAGVVADVTASGKDAQWMATASAYDVIVLDVMLPDMDGFDTCVQLRRAGVWTPIIMVTARDAVSDRVRGLDVGADDYLIKPFSLEELLARLRALARREGVERPTVMVVGTLRTGDFGPDVGRSDQGGPRGVRQPRPARR
jgi:two-component system OmpR family response regulator